MLQVHLRNNNFTGFFKYFDRKLRNIFKERLLMTASVTVQRKTIIIFTFESLSKQSFSKCLEQIKKFLGSGSFLLIFCSHSSRTLWKLRFGFFVERLVQPTALQFGIFNVKRKCFVRCLTSTRIKT